MDIFTFRYCFKGYFLGKKVLKYFDYKVKNTNILDTKNMLDVNIYFNSGLPINNYIHLPTNIFDFKDRIMTTKEFKKLFKADAYDIFAFFIFDMHKSFKEEHSDYFYGLYMDYVNFFNQEV
ncbi:hypothetical protein ACXYRK_01965 [Mycoplasma sp. AC1221]